MSLGEAVVIKKVIYFFGNRLNYWEAYEAEAFRMESFPAG
jgi:hypothetical protein